MYGMNDQVLNLEVKYLFLFKPERLWMLREVLDITSVYMYIERVYVYRTCICKKLQWMLDIRVLLTARRILGLTKSVDGRTAIASIKV